MIVDGDTKVSELFLELSRLGVHSLSSHRTFAMPGSRPRVMVSAGYGEKIAHASGADAMEAFGNLLAKIEAGFADELVR